MKEYLFNWVVGLYLLFGKEKWVIYNTGDQIAFVTIFGKQVVTRIITWNNIRWSFGQDHLTMPER